jgi:uncharacterized membrane protein
MTQAGQRGSEIVETIKRAYAEFLTLPSIMIAGFLVLGGVTAALDAAEVAWLSAARDFLRAHFFSDGQATSDLLGAIATGLVTLTSIAISLLLIAVQQAAAAMSTQIYDQFLRGRSTSSTSAFSSACRSTRCSSVARTTRIALDNAQARPSSSRSRSCFEIAQGLFRRT